MKANEAPEKIWMTDEWFWQFDDKDFMDEDSVEYTRTDAFIEKACEWIRNNYHNYADNALGKEYLTNDFKNYMKEE